MPRKLKTFVTSVGFFDLAIAAPSMKAALEAWGAGKKLFEQGFAYETDDPTIVAATVAQPGVVLKRAVGTKGAFKENAELPSSLPANAPHRAPKQKTKPKQRAPKTAKKKPAEVVNLAERRAAKQAAHAYEKEQARRERVEQKEEAARAKQRARRKAATRKAEATLEKAQKHHDAAMKRIETKQTALDNEATDENTRWEKEKRKLDAAVRKAED